MLNKKKQRNHIKFRILENKYYSWFFKPNFTYMNFYLFITWFSTSNIWTY